MKPEPSDRRSYNVPGLVAKKMDYNSPQIIKETEVPIHDRSLESHEFEYVTSGSVKMEDYNHKQDVCHGGINISSLHNVKANNGSTMRTKINIKKQGATLTHIPPFPKQFDSLNHPRTQRGSVFNSERSQEKAV